MTTDTCLYTRINQPNRIIYKIFNKCFCIVREAHRKLAASKKSSRTCTFLILTLEYIYIYIYITFIEVYIFI